MSIIPRKVRGISRFLLRKVRVMPSFLGERCLKCPAPGRKLRVIRTWPRKVRVLIKWHVMPGFLLRKVRVMSSFRFRKVLAISRFLEKSV